ncbi:MAG TPA: PH domain-containing protein [Thermoplasmata archaeon]|nr:PH domain-containing protein [Thermoplasmata archaeon]
MPYQLGQGSRLVRRKILGDREVVRRASHESLWGVLPKLIVWIAVFGFVDYWLWTGLTTVLGTIPYLTPVMRTLVSAGSDARLTIATIALLVPVAAGVYGFFVLWRWARYVFAVTNFRVLHQYGILGTEFEEIPLVQIRDVEVKQSMVQRALRIGFVRLNSLQFPGAAPVVASQHPGRRPDEPPGVEEWLLVPDPYGIEKDVESLTEALVANRSGGPAPVVGT